MKTCTGWRLNKCSLPVRLHLFMHRRFQYFSYLLVLTRCIQYLHRYTHSWKWKISQKQNRMYSQSVVGGDRARAGSMFTLPRQQTLPRIQLLSALLLFSSPLVSPLFSLLPALLTRQTEISFVCPTRLLVSHYGLIQHWDQFIEGCYIYLLYLFLFPQISRI